MSWTLSPGPPEGPLGGHIATACMIGAAFTLAWAIARCMGIA